MSENEPPPERQPPTALPADLPARVDAARRLLESCSLCPRCCGVNRLAGETGVCQAGPRAVVASYGPHFGEEPALVGHGGSGTIFFSHCSLRCVFCQNSDISRGGEGREVTTAELAAIMLELQRQGCHNINLVTPTHYLPQILEAVAEARARGLELPLVWNSGGYDSVEALRLLEGVVDIYMPDAKYACGATAAELSGTPPEGSASYPEACRAALREMHRQVGDLVLDSSGLAARGLLVRHLVLPEGLAGTEEVMAFLAELSPRTVVSLLSQYHPCYQAWGHPNLGRRITLAEYQAALAAVRDRGLPLVAP